MQGQRKLADAMRSIASPYGAHPGSYGGGWRCCAYGVLVLVYLIVHADGMQHNDSEPIVNTKWGFIRGKWDKSLHGRQFASFLGIPYALPPLGDLRFRSPRRWDCTWTTVRDATVDAKGCVQVNKDFDVIGSEDCLYLNVFVPTFSDSECLVKFPVLVFIHGGAFSKDSSHSTRYAPDYLMDHEAIVVTLNYRLNVLGFFSTTNQVAPGNYGLKDMMMALQWVQENIHSFGGDSESVTVMGSSAGSASAHLLSLSKRTEKLFGKLILQSGSALGIWAVQPRKIYKQTCLELARLAGCLPERNNDTVASDETTTENPERENERAKVVWNNIWNNRRVHNLEDDEEMMKCMRTVDVERIQKATKHFIVWKNSPFIVFAPTLEEDSEDAIVTVHPMTIMKNGLFRDIPLMIQTVQNEGLVKTADFFVDPDAKDEMIENFEQYLLPMVEYQQTVSDASTFATAIQDFYFNGNLTLNLKENITDMVGDALILWSIYQVLQYQSELGKSNIYFSIFAYDGTFTHTFFTGSPLHYGVCHGDDLNYVFPLLNNAFKDQLLHNTEDDITMIHIVTEMITSFVQKGVPSAWMIPAWPEYREHHQCMRFGIGRSPDIIVQAAFASDRMEFWDELMANVSVERDMSVDDIPEQIVSAKASAGTIGRELTIHLGFLTIVILLCAQ